jgi:hypothetical protein
MLALLREAVVAHISDNGTDFLMQDRSRHVRPDSA